MVQNLINVDRCSGGVFVEFGARDGWRESNTYFFEKSLGWRGLLLEADPRQVMQLHANRKASVIVEGAVCPRGSPSNVTILSSRIGGFSGFASTFEKSRMRTVTKRYTVPCHSLETLLRQHHMHRVDYMTIDTEGSEALIINDFPWRQFDVRVVQVEQLDEARFHSQAGKQEQITRRRRLQDTRLQACTHHRRATRPYLRPYIRQELVLSSRCRRQCRLYAHQRHAQKPSHVAAARTWRAAAVGPQQLVADHVAP